MSGLVSTTLAEILVVYSFTNSTVGQTNKFTNDFASPTIVASTMSTHNMGMIGIVTNFIGATDNDNYSNFFDEKGFAAGADILINGGTIPEPTNNYLEFSLCAKPGRAVAITHVGVDFGLDDSTTNMPPATQAEYDLYLSLDGTNFTAIGTTSINNNAGKTYPGYTILNNLDKSVTGFSGVTNPITFRLAFADSNSDSDEKRVFFDDIVVIGTSVPTVELTVDDAIAYEREAALVAQFSVDRSDTNAPLFVDFVLSHSTLTNGAATRGTDYTVTPNSPIQFGPEEPTKKVRINPINDSQIEPPETITLTLLPSTNYVVVGPSNAVAVLYDDDLPQLPVCFSDDFNREASSNNWTIVTGGDPLATPVIDFAYDYSVDGIPPAPGSTDTLGLKLGFGSTVGYSQAVVNLFHTSGNCSTNKYALSFYVYLQYNATNSAPQHALAGINANNAKTNLVYFPPLLAINGEGQFVTLVGNEATNADYARAHLWQPPGPGPLANFPPGLTIRQLLNNPPYGANGGVAGILGCDVASTNKTWLHCQLIQLDNRVRVTINRYPVMEATIANNDAQSLTQGDRNGVTSIGSGVIMLGYLNGVMRSTNTDQFAVFDNVELRDLDGIVFTSMAIRDANVFLNFYSDKSEDYDPHDFTILKSINDVRAFQGWTNNFPEVWHIPDVYRIPEEIKGATGYFGAALYYEFTNGIAPSFFRVGWTNGLGPSP